MALIDQQGRVAAVRVVKRVTEEAGLVAAAVSNVERRAYRPATKDGEPVSVWLAVGVRFQLGR
jgi:hypothetical protein